MFCRKFADDTLKVPLASAAVVADWEDYFPWVLLGVYTQSTALPVSSYIVVSVTGLLGMAATHAWWMTADQSKRG